MNTEAHPLSIKQLKDNWEVMLVIVQKNGGAIEYASIRLQGNWEVALATVQEDSKAIEYVSEHLKLDKAVVLASVREMAWHLGVPANTSKATGM